jgi:hypothetical protein
MTPLRSTRLPFLLARVPARFFSLVRVPARFDSFLLALLLALGGLSWLADAAQAQPMGKTVIVPFGVPDGRDALSPADALESDLTRRRVRVVSMHEARDRFTVRSRTPLVASESDLDVLAKEAREALQHVAFGRTSAAEKSVREVIQRAERALESLNRETARARQILDACLSLVRNSLHEGKREDAVEHAMRCRRLVPDLAPSDTAHPANVVGVLAEADDLLRRMRTGKLTVKSQPDTACSVYLNGRHLGTTPFVLDRAASGEYRVQVECAPGRPGRVHTVLLGDEPVSMAVDTAFDRAVFSDPRLFLSYETERSARRFLVEHAASVGRDVRAEDVVLLRVQNDVAELVRVHVAQNRMVGRARATFTSAGFDRASLSKAIAALAEGRVESEALGTLEPEVPAAPVLPPQKAAPPTTESGAPPPAPTQTGPAQTEVYPAWRYRTGYAMIPLAIAFAGLGFGLDAWARSLHSDLEDAQYGDAAFVGQEEQHDSVAAATYLGVASAPFGLAAVALLAEPRASVPWWSYTLGVLGLGAAGAGIYLAAIDNQCQLREVGTGVCLHASDTKRAGVLLVAAAVPLISVPVFHLVRRTGQPGATARVGAMRVTGGAGVSIAGAF